MPTTTEPGILIAFGAGLLSFLSPCVLPLIPGYVSFVTGHTVADLRRGSVPRGSVLWRTSFFSLGFSAVFIALGLAFGTGSALLGTALRDANRIITIVGGIVIIVFGLNILFDFIGFLNFGARAGSHKKPRGALEAFFAGAAFGAGWTPCVGPILASILLYATRSDAPWAAGGLLAAYSAGLAFPFLLVGLFFDRLEPVLAFFRRHAHGVKIVSGIFLILLGLVMAFGRLSVLAATGVRLGSALSEFAQTMPFLATVIGIGIQISVAVAFIAPPLLSGRRISAFRLSVAGMLVISALLEALGIWGFLRLVSAWLVFQGA